MWYHRPASFPGQQPYPCHLVSLPTAASHVDVPRSCRCFSLPLCHLYRADGASQRAEPIGIRLVGGSGDQGWNCCHVLRNPAQGSNATGFCYGPSKLPRQGAAAKLQQKKKRKMPAVATCEGKRQEQSTTYHSAFDAVPPSTQVLKC